MKNSYLRCPKCYKSNIGLLSTDNNMKVKHKTSLNLNPLHPLTITNTKTTKKEKLSAKKVGLAWVTCGASIAFTGGLKNKAHNEYFCQDCGYRWIGE